MTILDFYVILSLHCTNDMFKLSCSRTKVNILKFKIRFHWSNLNCQKHYHTNRINAIIIWPKLNQFITNHNNAPQTTCWPNVSNVSCTVEGGWRFSNALREDWMGPLPILVVEVWSRSGFRAHLPWKHEDYINTLRV